MLKARSASHSAETVGRLVARMVGLAFIDGIALWLAYQMLVDGVWYIALPITAITIFINAIFLKSDAYPLRWISPGLAFLVLLVLYPLVFTVYMAFTNYGDGHLLTKRQAISLLESSHRFLPEGAETYRWTAFRSGEGQFILWLESTDGQTYLVAPDSPITPTSADQSDPGTVDDTGLPSDIDGHQRLTRAETVRYISDLERLEFGVEPEIVTVRSLDAAAQYQQRYRFESDLDGIVDQQTGIVYTAHGGAFVSPEGTALRPGFQINVGFHNFERLLTTPALRGPFLRVFAWTFAFAILSVLSTFLLGLLLALATDARQLPMRRTFRSLLIIPYAIPGFISILIWVGLLNPRLGVVNQMLGSVFGWTPAWFADPWAAKAGVLLVNLWLGFPYMMLINSGALQSIPQDFYDAAEVDGAGGVQRLRRVTLPLLLVSVGPLLLGSFALNFNNFTVIYLYNGGGPPIAGTPTPAGHTDILISYTFRLAFEGGRGADYGYAAAITIAIFLIIALITVFNFRFTKTWEQVSESA